MTKFTVKYLHARIHVWEYVLKSCINEFNGTAAITSSDVKHESLRLPPRSPNYMSRINSINLRETQ